MNTRYLLAAGATFLLLAGCSKHEFSIEGEVKNASGQTILLEQQDAAAGWIPLDSMKITGADFRFEAPAPESPCLYRLVMDGKYIYLPVDSTDQLHLTADFKNFGSDFELTGSAQARQLTSFEREAHRIEAYNNPDSTAAFRKRVYNSYLKDAKGNNLSYYILTRPMNGAWLIDYTDPLYSAVATSFQTYRPDDPRTALLAERAAAGVAERRRAAGKGVKMQASSSGMIPISLPGLDGKDIPLSNLLDKGKPVIVAFIAMTGEQAPTINRELRKLYEAGRADIYEVCLDSDQFAWRQASRPLPWTVVFDPEGEHSRAALSYNVGSLPAFFIYNSKGDLVNSTGNPANISSML